MLSAGLFCWQKDISLHSLLVKPVHCVDVDRAGSTMSRATGRPVPGAALCAGVILADVLAAMQSRGQLGIRVLKSAGAIEAGMRSCQGSFLLPMPQNPHPQEL